MLLTDHLDLGRLGSVSQSHAGIPPQESAAFDGPVCPFTESRSRTPGSFRNKHRIGLPQFHSFLGLNAAERVEDQLLALTLIRSLQPISSDPPSNEIADR